GRRADITGLEAWHVGGPPEGGGPARTADVRAAGRLARNRSSQPRRECRHNDKDQGFREVIMRRLCTLLLPLLAGLVLVHATPASAALKKVWVSNAGLDSASCGDVVVPCRTFQQAHDNLLPGGDIGVLTPGDYGNVLIKKSLTITNDGGGEAGVAVTLFAGLYIDAGPGGIVGLRGLIFEGHVGGGLGIQVFSASAVHIQNCVIRN